MRQALVLTVLSMALAAAQPPLPLAHVAFRVTNLDRSIKFYQKLGFEQAFEFRDDGKVSVAFIKVKDRQFIELYAPAAGQSSGFMHNCFETDNIEKLRLEFLKRGLAPGPISKGRAGNLLFSMQRGEYLQYLPASLHQRDRGKHLGTHHSELLRYEDPGELTLVIDEAGRAPFETSDPDGVLLRFIAKPATVADALIATPASSYAFNWGEGVQMMGLAKYARVTHNTRYADYLDRWARIYEAQDLEVLLGTVRPGYCGHWSPAAAIQYLQEFRPSAGHERLVNGVVRFIETRAERSTEGSLGHFEGSHQLWVDTLFMACPLLAATGHADEAARQLALYASHLQDPATGLFWHMWDWQTNTHSEGYWGRGNGWVLMSLADVLEVKRDPALEKITSTLTNGVLASQNADGLWYTVLDDPTSYVECSATAMFVYGLLKLARLGVLPSTVRVPANKAWRAINERYVRDGQVLGVSAGTDPKGKDSYRSIALGKETWGTGAYLLAASEVALLR